MQLEVIGVGGAGCRIADSIAAADSTGRSFVGDAFAFDVDSDEVTALSEIPVANRHRYGQTIDGGLEGDLQSGFSVGDAHVDELSRQLDRGQPSVADAFLVCLGLGGATGGGTAPALVANLKTLYDAPVYALTTLPAKRELEPPTDDGDDPSRRPTQRDPHPRPDREHRPLAEENAVRTLERLEGRADAVICFDNEAWLRAGESLSEARDRLNHEFATRVAAVFAATAGASDEQVDAESVVDTNDVARIFGSRTDVITLGYGTQDVETDDGGSLLGLGLFTSKESVDTSAAVSAVETTISKALRGRLTLECERGGADRALLLVGGPPAWLNRQAIADGRSLLETTTGSAEILSGDVPRPDGDAVFAIVALAGVGPASRLEQLRSETRPFERDRARGSR